MEQPKGRNMEQTMKKKQKTKTFVHYKNTYTIENKHKQNCIVNTNNKHKHKQNCIVQPYTEINTTTTTTTTTTS